MAKIQTKERKMYLRIRNVCGLLGAILPFLAFASAALVPDKDPRWWWSISSTYYYTPAMVMTLVPACIVLISYIGYDFWDNFVTTAAGISGLGIALFPCKVPWLEPDTLVGFFQIPMSVSWILHMIFACFFTLLMAINSAFIFVKSKPGKPMGPKKKRRNHIYRACGYSMLVLIVVFIFIPSEWVIGMETLSLILFGISWLVKGETFPSLRDPVEV